MFRNWILPGVLIGVVTFALVFVSAARAAGQDSRINAVASAVAGHPVIVSCATTTHEWAQFEDTAGLTFETDGFTFASRDNVVFLAPRICETLLADFQYGPTLVGDYMNALALRVLIHESVHQRGVTDESMTDCTALTLVEHYALSFGYAAKVTSVSYVRVKDGHYRRVVKVVPNPALERLYTQALASHRLLPASYQTVC